MFFEVLQCRRRISDYHRRRYYHRLSTMIDSITRKIEELTQYRVREDRSYFLRDQGPVVTVNQD